MYILYMYNLDYNHIQVTSMYHACTCIYNMFNTIEFIQ